MKNPGIVAGAAVCGVLRSTTAKAVFQATLALRNKP
jgi:hypothetical protein